MTLADDLEKALAPLRAEVATSCAGCGRALDTGYVELNSSLRLCSDCVDDLATTGGYYNDTDLIEAEATARHKARREIQEELEPELQELRRFREGAVSNREEPY